MREIEQHFIERRAERDPTGGRWPSRCRARRAAARGVPWRTAGSVSDVEVSLSTVIALNEPRTDRDSSVCKASAPIAASVKTKASMVAISGAIIPAPLAKRRCELRRHRSAPRGSRASDRCRWS